MNAPHPHYKTYGKVALGSVAICRMVPFALKCKTEKYMRSWCLGIGGVCFSPEFHCEPKKGSAAPRQVPRHNKKTTVAWQQQ